MPGVVAACPAIRSIRRSSAAEECDQNREDDADHEAGGQGNVETPVLPPDHDVPRQSAKSQLGD